MKRTLKYYLTGAVVTAAVAGMATMSYAAPATPSHGAPAEAEAAQLQAAAPAGKDGAATAIGRTTGKKAPTPRVVAPGERVTAAPGFRLWLTAEGKHWTTPSLPGLEQFRSAVGGNIDLGTPGVSVQSEISDGRAYLSGLYYGGRGTASTVEIETASGTVHGKLIELSGDPGWGVWYATADVTPDGGPLGFVSEVTVRTTKGALYAQLTTR
ncbi:hypothetical protein GCM10010261_29360 [Streptomyces pilosus]|uniref:hypothetical protein n=1 Tax=Streptomyces pilosus TaxID=28893 RepID=UPI001678F101|nr:hypothetical protein [Streptomyces pilosus]GGV50626.1 hypothetical protein GCM10010261_29360 [Streptomyces pilosus]